MLLVRLGGFNGDGSCAEEIDVVHFAVVGGGEGGAVDGCEALGEETADADADDCVGEVAIVEEVVLRLRY